MAMPGEKTAPLVGTGSLLFSAQQIGNNLTASSNALCSQANPGIGADGKLTQEERERTAQGSATTVALHQLAHPDCRNS